MFTNFQYAVEASIFDKERDKKLSLAQGNNKNLALLENFTRIRDVLSLAQCLTQLADLSSKDNYLS